MLIWMFIFSNQIKLTSLYLLSSPVARLSTCRSLLFASLHGIYVVYILTSIMTFALGVIDYIDLSRTSHGGHHAHRVVYTCC